MNPTISVSFSHETLSNMRVSVSEPLLVTQVSTSHVFSPIKPHQYISTTLNYM